LRTIKTISRAWSTDLGFKGNVENYYEVENSCVDVCAGDVRSRGQDQASP